MSASSVDELRFNPVGTLTTDSSLSTAKTLTKPTGANKILIRATAQNVIYTLDGATDPTTAAGHLLKAGDPDLLIPIQANIRVIEAAASATIYFQWGN